MNNLGGDGMMPSDRRRHRYGETGKAGWYFWFPFLMGLMFLILGVPMLIGAAVVPAGASGLVVSGVLFLVLGAGFVYWAFRAMRDIRSVEPDAPLPGSLSPQTATELVTTGLARAGHDHRVHVRRRQHGGGHHPRRARARRLDRAGRDRPHDAPVPHAPAAQRAPGKGATVPVKVSTTDASKLLVEWDGLVAPNV